MQSHIHQLFALRITTVHSQRWQKGRCKNLLQNCIVSFASIGRSICALSYETAACCACCHVLGAPQARAVGSLGAPIPFPSIHVAGHVLPNGTMELDVSGHSVRCIQNRASHIHNHGLTRHAGCSIVSCRRRYHHVSPVRTQG